MKIKGIKRGQNIELLEPLNDVPDGTEILVDLDISLTRIDRRDKSLSDEERLAKLNKLFGAWKDRPDLLEAFAKLDEERHNYRGRNVDDIDSNPDKD